MKTNKQKTTAIKLFPVLFLLLFSLQLQAQTTTVTGTVVDAADNMPLPGATIMQKGTSQGTVTDLDGNYQIEVIGDDAVLVFSFVGYTDLEKPVNGQSVVNAALGVATTDLDEVIVIGYGTQKKSDKTGAVAQVSADELNQGVITDPIQAMQGKTAGVSISKKGGDPNAGFSVKIRGASGLHSGTSPLYVIDGVPGVDPTTVSPEDIESFNILKDASSTAIYGSRGANGVVIITTKRGSEKAGSRVEFNSYYSIDQVAKRLDLMSADELREFATENGYNLQDGGANTDWQDEIFRTGISQSYNVAASGGDKSTAYRVSIAHTDFQGVVIGTSKARTIGRINLNQKAINDKLNIQASISQTIEKNDYEAYGANGNNDILYHAFQRNPTDPVYDENDEFYEVQRDFNYYNPVALAEQIQNERAAKRFFGNLKMDLSVFDGFTAGVNMGYTRDDSESFYFEPSFVRGGTSSGQGSRSYGNMGSSIIETTLNYTKQFNEHSINAVAGYSFQEDVFDGFSARGDEPLSDFVLSHNLGVLNDVTVGDISSYKSSNRLISMFGRAVYNFGSRYYFTATVRRDGSSKFGDNKEWGLFPSASISWNIKEEAFLQDFDPISQLKFRVGYGLSGNQEIASYLDLRYAYAAGTTINFETGDDAIEFKGSHNSNPNLQWEENSELNVGVDFGVLDNRISGSFEYYDKRTYNLLAPYAVPVPPNIESTTWANAGEISNKGLELNLQIYVMNNKNFDWKSNFSWSSNDQMVEKLSSDKYEWTEGDKKQGWLQGRGLVGDQNWTQLVEEGYSLGTFYMPEYAGMSEDGKFLFHTAAGGVTRNVADAERRVVGNALPDFEIGWSNYIKFYKYFDFSFALRAVVGNDVLNVTRMVFANPNILPTLNGLTEVKEAVADGLTDAPKVNSYYLEDGSFVRLDNITLGYSMNTEKFGWLHKLRVYVSSNNLLLLTKYTGLDPETYYDGLSFGLDQYNVYPKTKTYTFGLNLTF